MFLYKESKDGFRKDTSMRYIGGVSSGMFKFSETDGHDASRNHEKNANWYRIAAIAFVVILMAANITMIIWPPVYGMVQVVCVNALGALLIFHNVNLLSMSKQKIGYQDGRESFSNIKKLFKK